MTNIRNGQAVATFQDRFGEERQIYRQNPRGALKVAKNTDTVSHKLNRVAAVLIGQRIRDRRIAAGLSLEELCLRAGLKAAEPKSRMWEIENATRQNGLRTGTLYAIAHALNCEASELLPPVQEVSANAGVTVRVQAALSVAR